MKKPIMSKVLHFRTFDVFLLRDIAPVVAVFVVLSIAPLLFPARKIFPHNSKGGIGQLDTGSLAAYVYSSR